MWPLNEVMEKIEKRLTENYTKVENLANEDQIDWTTAAYIIAIRRIETAYIERGIFP